MARASMNWLIRHLRMQINDSVPIALADDEYYVGDAVKLSNTYKDLDGVLTDPTSPTITITDPNGTVTVNAATPTQESTGVYFYYYAPTAVEGYWKVEFGGTVSTLATAWPFQRFRVFLDEKFTWTDDELQRILDANRRIIRRELLRADVDGKQYASERGMLEGSVVTWDDDDTIIAIWNSDSGSATAATPDSWNLTDGIFTWTSDQNATYYLDAKTYNIHAAIADCMDQLSMDRARAVSWSRGGVSYTYNNFIDLAKTHRALAGARSTKLVRTYRTER